MCILSIDLLPLHVVCNHYDIIIVLHNTIRNGAAQKCPSQMWNIMCGFCTGPLTHGTLDIHFIDFCLCFCFIHWDIGRLFHSVTIATFGNRKFAQRGEIREIQIRTQYFTDFTFSKLRIKRFSYIAIVTERTSRQKSYMGYGDEMAEWDGRYRSGRHSKKQNNSIP